MKRTCFCLFLFLTLTLSLRGQVRFSKYYDYNKYTDLASNVITLGDSGYFTVSKSTDFTQEDTLNSVVTTVCFIRTDIYGDTLWTKAYRKKGYFLRGTSIIRTSFGFLYAGDETDLVTYKQDNIGSTIIIWALNETGDTLYTKNYNITVGDEIVTDLLPTADNGYAVYGQTCTQTGNSCDYFLMKLDSASDRQWTKTYTQASTSFENPASFLQDSLGNYYLLGQSTISGIMKCLLIKTDKNGTMLWKRVYSDHPRQSGSGITSLHDGNLLLTGGFNTNISGTGSSIANIIKIDTAGSKLWEKVYGQKQENFYGAVEESNGDFTLVGINTIADTSKSRPCGWLMRVNSSGDSLFQRIYNVHPVWSEILYSIKKTADGYIMVGTSVNPADASTKVDTWLLKVDNWGCLEEGCQNTGIAYENHYTQVVVYPNPATNVLNTATSLKLATYNIFNHYGVLVSSGALTDHSISVADLVPGLYIIRFIGANNTISSAKFVKD